MRRAIKIMGAMCFYTFVSIAISGCNSYDTLQASDVLEMNSFYATTVYTLGVGDTIAIKFFYNKELNEELTIRPDGMISLQLIGDVKAAGLSSSQLVSLLKEKYSLILESMDGSDPGSVANKPEVAVFLKQSVSQVVYVGGQIQRPGRVLMSGHLRLMDAIILTGGPLDTAELEKTTLIRINDSQQPETSLVNLKMIAKGEMPDIILRPLDVVYLPKTGIAEVSWVFQQYLHSLIPVNGNVTYNVNPEVEVK